MISPGGPAQHAPLPSLIGARLALTGAGPQYRRQLAELTDTALVGLWQAATTRLGIGTGVALAAVGSHGRRDAGPTSDLDLMLLHDGTVAPDRLTALARDLWYPIWDAGLDLDHSVRSLAQCRQVASADVLTATGLLDLRHQAGDAELSGMARSAVFGDWRATARHRLPELILSTRDRASTHGELANLAEADLKESSGGLRDAVVCAALSASGLADRPHSGFDSAYQRLLDARDALAVTTGRHTHVLRRRYIGEVASRLGHCNADDLLAELAECGRVIAAALAVSVHRARRGQRARTPWRRPVRRHGRRPPPRLPAVPRPRPAEASPT